MYIAPMKDNSNQRGRSSPDVADWRKGDPMSKKEIMSAHHLGRNRAIVNHPQKVKSSGNKSV